ncbi:MAG: hypothetical protein ABI210_01690 [Abditibacteriaceae bacterium]
MPYNLNVDTITSNTATPTPQPAYWQPLLWLAGLILLTIGLAFVPVPNRLVQALGALVITILYVALILGFVVSATRRSSLRALLIGANISLLCWMLFRFLPWGFIPSFIVRNALTDAALTSSAVFLGALVARPLIRTPNMLGPICGIIALIDIWGVLFGGIVAQLLVRAPDIASRSMTHGPAVGVATKSFYTISLPSVGIGDYLFLGILFAALSIHQLNVRGAWRLVWPLMTVALLAVMFGIAALPGLLFIGLGVAIPNRKYFQYSREEKFALLYASIFVVILTVGLYLMLISMLDGKH